MAYKKKLLVMGGIAQQCDIIREAQNSGYHVIVVDYLEDSPGKLIADESYLISITDVEEIVKLCVKLEIDGVMNYCIDPGQKPYQRICELLDIPCYGTKEQFNILTNKDLFKKTCIEYGIDVVPSYDININKIEESIDNFEFPVVIKPADSRASKGITICYNKNEIHDAIESALFFSKRKIIDVEKYMSCPELCAKYFVCDGEVFLTAFSDTNTLYVDGKRVYINGKSYPSKYYRKFRESADLKLREMIKGLGIMNGPLSFSGFFDEGAFRFFDPSFRMGGGQEWKTIEAVSGINISKCMTNFAITGSMGNVDYLRSIDCKFDQKRSATLQFLVKPGIIGKIIGIEAALKLNSVVAHHMSHNVGDVVSRIGTSDHVVMRILLVANTSSMLIRDYLNIRNAIKIFDVNGEDMLYDMFDDEFLCEIN